MASSCCAHATHVRRGQNGVGTQLEVNVEPLELEIDKADQLQNKLVLSDIISDFHHELVCLPRRIRFWRIRRGRTTRRGITSASGTVLAFVLATQALRQGVHSRAVPHTALVPSQWTCPRVLCRS